MHVVYLVHQFPIDGIATGGAGNYVANMARIMNDHGHKVTVITEARKGEIILWHGIQVRKIDGVIKFKKDGRPLKTWQKFIKNLSRSFAYNREVARVNKMDKVDIVQSASSYGIPFLRLKDIPYIVRISEYPSLWSGAARKNFDFEKCVKAKRLDEEVSFWAMKKADALLMPSFLMKELIYARVGKMGIVIESPVVIRERELTRLQEITLLQGEYLLTYGSLSYRKEIHILKKVIREFLERYPDKKFIVIGRDREILVNGHFIMASEYLRENLKENNLRLIIMGEIQDRMRLFNIVKNAYACVLPTRIDNLPNTVLEAMSLGKIVISSTSEYGTSVEQLIVDGTNGFLAQVEDSDDIMRKIHQVMCMSADERARIENAAKERTSKLDPESVYQKMIALYESTIAKTNGNSDGF